ncbi:hypothetical protein [Mucilaginibacter rubeus]|uniref:Uncharacterized protein n=1 Tax=Mucilaginibacter rubeus TaxID=2027860 RepID=A0A5C1I5H7_9SPHI|nr:hypothetical protein [Mucilaginibacter rubeus]QEM13185.1 hypothetical protein DEO27_025300 [Mucilaginibacter rubeus]
MHNTALFLLQDWFNISGRGLVIAGQITEGQINSGDYICLDEVVIKIKSVEIGDRTPNAFFIGLILDTNNQGDMLSSLTKLRGKNLSVIKAITF